MSQTFTAFTGSTDLGDTPTIINANFDAIRSNWAGTSAPGSPVVGQPFYNTTTGKITIWDGSSWVDSANTSTTVLANTAELLAARGTAANLNARLSVAMNPDGTLKDTLPVGDWWMDEGDIVEYVSSSSFTVEGDKTAIYIENRALFLIQATSEYNYVVSSSYSSGTDLTTVTTLNENVDSGLSSVQYGQPVENAPVVTVTSIGAEPADADILKRDVSAILTKGFPAAPAAMVTTGPTPATGALQTIDTSGGAVSLAAPAQAGVIRFIVTGGNELSPSASYDSIDGAYDTGIGLAQGEIVSDGTNHFLTIINGVGA